MLIETQSDFRLLIHWEVCHHVYLDGQSPSSPRLNISQDADLEVNRSSFPLRLFAQPNSSGSTSSARSCVRRLPTSTLLHLRSQARSPLTATSLPTASPRSSEQAFKLSPCSSRPSSSPLRFNGSLPSSSLVLCLSISQSTSLPSPLTPSSKPKFLR